jgi:hypothetical protein
MGYINVYSYNVTGDCQNIGAGSVSFSITGDTPPFAVNCINSGLPPTSALTAPYEYSATSLTADTYFLQITDGSSTSIIQAVYISSGTTATIDSSNTTCGLDNGTVTGFTSGVYGAGATFTLYDGSYNLISSDTSPFPNYTFTSLSADTYYIVANDGGGCSGITASVIINPSTPFNFGYYVVDDAGCASSSGKIFVTGLTPTSAYTYSWSSNVGTQTGSTVTGLTAGTYTVTVTNPVGCISSSAITVTQVQQVGSAGFITTPPTCFQSNGVVEAILTGGTAPFYYSGSTGEVGISFDTSFTFTNVPAGVFNVIVTDAGLCTYSASVTLNTPSSFTTVNAITTNSTCSSSDGSLQIIVDGGATSAVNLQTQISGSTGIVQSGTIGNANQTFYGLPNGTYIYTVSSAGCTYTGTTTITSVNKYTVTATTSGTTCGYNNGSLNVVVSTGGTLPYTFTLTGPDYSPVTTSGPIGIFGSLAYGNYTLTVQDAGSPTCIQSYPIYIGYSQNMYFDLNPANPVNGNDGQITTTIYSGVPPFTLTWTGNVNGQTGSTVTGLTSGTYGLTITDSSGCTLTKSVTLMGTTLYSDYMYHTICEDMFKPNGSIGVRNIRSMYYEGFTDLTSGDTNCIVNSAVFSIYTDVDGDIKITPFYTSSGSTDYPNDVVWADTIVTALESYVGITDVVVDLVSNRVSITSGCEKIKKDCILQSINPLQDTVITVKLNIDYEISCVSCNP